MKQPLMLRERERRLTLITAMFLGCWVFVSWLAQPLWQHVRELQDHVATQSQKLEARSRLLAKAPSVERRYQELAAYLQPSGGEPAQRAFLNELESLSRNANVHLNLKPRAVPQEQGMSRFEVELGVEGSQQALLAFLDALFRMPTLLVIERLRVSTVPAKIDEIRATLVLQKLTLHGP